MVFYDARPTLADLLDQARRDAVALPRDRLPGALSLSEGYSVQGDLDALAKRTGRIAAGWKIGLTTPAAQAAFAASEPMLGVIYADTVQPSGSTIDLGRLIAPRIEGEVLLEVGTPPPADADAAALLASLASVRAAFEIADSRIDGWPGQVGQAVADNACCAAVIAQPAGSPVAALDFTGARSELRAAGTPVATGLTSDCLGGILSAYGWLVGALARQQRSLSRGDLVLCGAIGGAVPLLAGTTYDLQIDGLEPVTLTTKEHGQ